MVNTRSGFNRESRFSREETNEYSGDEDNMSVVDHFAEDVNGNEDLNDMRDSPRRGIQATTNQGRRRNHQDRTYRDKG